MAFSRFLLDDRLNHSDTVYHAIYPTSLNLTRNQASFVLLANTTSPHATPIMLNTLDTALLRAVMERFADVRQLQLVTDDTKKTLAFYHSLGLRELSAFGCRGFMR